MSAQNEGPECQQEYRISASPPPPNYSLYFRNADNMEIGKFDFNGEGLEFEGNASESAIVFVNWIAESFAGRLKDERNKAREQCISILESAPEPDGIDLAEKIRREIER